MSVIIRVFIASLCLVASANALSQAVEVKDPSDDSGNATAGDYFQKRKKPADAKPRPAEDGSGAHYLAVHIGTFLDDQAYDWGQAKQTNVGELNLGVTYRLGEWINSADFALRADFTSYSLAQGPARKLSFLPMIMFPDASSRFPLYFGVGVGPGFYIEQTHAHSVLALDYQLVAGARFLNLIDNLGFFLEFGVKNDIQLFSPGQFNGLFIGTGAAWIF